MQRCVRAGSSGGRRALYSAAVVAVVMVALLLAFALPGQAQAVVYPGPVTLPYVTSYSTSWGDTGAEGTVILSNVNTWGVAAGPPNTTSFTTTRTYRITSITNWHNTPVVFPGGTISLLDSNGATLGTWTTNWVTYPFWKYARPDITISPGTYTIVDSASATWVYNTTSLWMGFTRVTAVEVNPVPVITSDGGGPTAHVYVPAGSSFITQVTATAPGPEALRYRILGSRFSPAYRMLVLDPVTGVLSFAPGMVSGLAWGWRQSEIVFGTVTVEVRDGGRPPLTDTQVITISLVPGNPKK